MGGDVNRVGCLGDCGSETREDILCVTPASVTYDTTCQCSAITGTRMPRLYSALESIRRSSGVTR